MRRTAGRRLRLFQRLAQIATACACLWIVRDATAQVRLPNVQVPQLPSIQLPVNVGDTLNSATGALDPNQLRDLRRLRIRELLRVNRRELEADPNGAPIVRAEIVVYAPTEATLRIADEQGFTVLRTTTLPGLDTRVVILKSRTNIATRTALRRLRNADPTGSYDYNHIYIESGEVNRNPATKILRLAAADSVAVTTQTKIGLIDTGIKRDHPSFQGAVEQFGCDSQPVPAAHGTAVASLLVGHATRFRGSVPDASLYSADVYCGNRLAAPSKELPRRFLGWSSDVCLLSM
jgi:hypothetical protein